MSKSPTPFDKYFKSLSRWGYIYVFLVAMSILSVMVERPEIGGYSDEDISIALMNSPVWLVPLVIVLMECHIGKNGRGKTRIINGAVIVFFLVVLSFLIYHLITYKADFYFWTYGFAVELLAYVHILWRNMFSKEIRDAAAR